MITQERLKEVLQYAPESGKFFWRLKIAKKAIVGQRAGFLLNGYWAVIIDGKRYRAHQLAWLYVYGKFSDSLLDHINRDCLDNRIANLREATKVQNSGNSKARKSRSGLKGVCWSKKSKKWGAKFQHSGRHVWLGIFDTAEEAHSAYCKAAKEKFGEFFHSGIPDEPGVNAV